MKHKRSDLEGDHSHRVCGPELIQLADGRYVLGTPVFPVSIGDAQQSTVVLGGLSAIGKLNENSNSFRVARHPPIVQSLTGVH